MDASQYTAPRSAPERDRKPRRTRPHGTLNPRRVGELLGQMQAGELRLARGFAECHGASPQQLEDIYQETVVALLQRQFASEEHLQNALRTGIKHRALRLHRDERTRARVLTRNASELQPSRHAEDSTSPEARVLLAQDTLLVAEFLTELTASEQRVFSLESEGLRYRSIAVALDIPVNQARKISRSCERKRERFQLLYSTGRLCGYRASTIRDLQEGRATSEELAHRAFAHLERCPSCRAAHRTNARRLRRAFQDQAAALLPIPALLTRASWLARLGARARLAHGRASTAIAGSPGVTRVSILFAGRPSRGQLAAGAGAAAVIALGGISAHRALNHHPAPPIPRHLTPAVTANGPESRSQAGTLADVLGRRAQGEHLPPRPQHRPAHRRATPRRANHSEATGFAYLGVPTPPPTPPAPAAPQGGPFSP